MIIQSDSRFLPLASGSVNCIITSPPYWSLRKYDIPDLVWDGEEGCEHEWGNRIEKHEVREETILGKTRTTDRFYGEESRRFDGNHQKHVSGQFCVRCSAWRGQLGLEPTIDLYLKHLMQIMDECKRVLRDDGTMWVNIGDSYWTAKGSCFNPGGGDNSLEKNKKEKGVYSLTRGNKSDMPWMPPKSLCLIPERFAIEMVNRGWILRNKIIWHKPNCMPASVKDRFTVDFEPVFFFVKSRRYWFEQILEPCHSGPSDIKKMIEKKDRIGGKHKDLVDPLNKASSSTEIGRKRAVGDPSGRNRRSVWTISTAPYSESHFATFPEALVEPMIKSGCPQFVCKKCGKARERILKSKFTSHESETDSKYEKGSAANRMSLWRQAARARGEEYHQEVEDLGLTDCGCNAGFDPGVVLDPFCGSGTVLKVAEKLQRKAIGIDLGYQELSGRRVKGNQVELMV